MSQLVKGLGLQNHSYTRLIHELGRSRENKLGMSLISTNNYEIRHFKEMY